MAPEVLSKGTAYDSSADWFSFGCMLYKLLKGHSPFRQHKTKVSTTTGNKDKAEDFVSAVFSVLIVFIVL